LSNWRFVVGQTTFPSGESLDSNIYRERCAETSPLGEVVCRSKQRTKQLTNGIFTARTGSSELSLLVVPTRREKSTKVMFFADEKRKLTVACRTKTPKTPHTTPSITLNNTIDDERST
jgi:hypothetical protein